MGAVVLGLGIHLDDVRARARGGAGGQQPVGPARQRIGRRRERERELVHRVVVVFVLARVAARLREARVDERAAGAADVRRHAVEDAPPRRVLVEALVDEVPDHAAAL